jgi:hypothetical protein
MKWLDHKLPMRVPGLWEDPVLMYLAFNIKDKIDEQIVPGTGTDNWYQIFNYVHLLWTNLVLVISGVR